MSTLKTPSRYKPPPRLYLSLFSVSMAVLSWEVLLTRLYSVLLYYHFAFLAVSVAMFGLTIGSLLAYGLKSNSLAEMDTHLATLAAFTGFLMAAAMTIQIVLIPPPMIGLARTAAFWIRIYILSSLPFIPAGIYISLALTRFEKPGKLYAADLLGAGLAAGILPLILVWCGGPGAIFATASLALAAACLHAWGKKRLRFWSYTVSGVLFLGFGLLNPQNRWLTIRWSHDQREPPIFFEAWNAFSRIIITPWTRI